MIGIGRARVLVTGAAPISPELIRWYLALGVDLVEGWGQTETSGFATANTPGQSRPGTVGKPMPGVEIRISDEGEILVRETLSSRVTLTCRKRPPKPSGMAGSTPATWANWMKTAS